MGFSQYYSSAGYAQYERYFVTWAEAAGYQIDYITQTDLHYNPSILDDYNCLVTVGHDEYWSWDMRKTVEDFVARGGHLARFGGNFLWQIRLENDGQTQVCWKTKAPTQDPIMQTDQKHLCTANWASGAVNWPGLRLSVLTVKTECMAAGVVSLPVALAGSPSTNQSIGSSKARICAMQISLVTKPRSSVMRSTGSITHSRTASLCR